jgi:hypothetical protein
VGVVAWLLVSKLGQVPPHSNNHAHVSTRTSVATVMAEATAVPASTLDAVGIGTADSQVIKKVMGLR